MTKKPNFDVVLWGGSSFVGKLVAEHLHQTYGFDGQIRWAIGGRSQRKLEDTRAWLGAGAEELPIIVGDARDRRFLGAMVKNTKVVLTTIGPYALHGKELVEACAANGTDYCIIGEVAVCLALDLPKSALSGGFWTPGAAIADKIIPRLVENAGMKFDVLTESGERFPVESSLFGVDETDANENQITECAAQ